MPKPCRDDIILSEKLHSISVQGESNVLKLRSEDSSIRKYKVSGTTVKEVLYAGDGRERYFHIYYSDQKAGAGHEQIEAKIDRMAKYLDKVKGKKS